MRRKLLLTGLAVLGLALIACRAASMAFDRLTGSLGSTATVVVTPAPLTEAAPVSTLPVLLTPGAKPPVFPTTEVPPPRSPSEEEFPAEAPPPGKLPQSNAAEIRPPDRRAELSRLSNLIGYRLVDPDGSVLGASVDYIINTCETYIVYMVVEPAPGLNVTPGDRPIVPFELVTVNSGALDAAARSIVVQVTPVHLAYAPAFFAGLPLLPAGWEAPVRAYWERYARLSNLTTECRVSGGPVQKIAYATELIGAGLHDNLQNPLGVVEDAVLEPESGKLGFFVVRRHANRQLVLVPLRVVNIPKEAFQPDGTVSLVLLTENSLFLKAPAVESLEAAASPAAQNAARAYWR